MLATPWIAGLGAGGPSVIVGRNMALNINFYFGHNRKQPFGSEHKRRLKILTGANRKFKNKMYGQNGNFNPCAPLTRLCLQDQVISEQLSTHKRREEESGKRKLVRRE